MSDLHTNGHQGDGHPSGQVNVMPGVMEESQDTKQGRRWKFNQTLGGVGHRILDDAKRYGSSAFNNSSRFFATDKQDMVGSAYRQVVDLVFVLGVIVSAFVSYFFAPAGPLRIVIAIMLFIGLFTVEWGMHQAGRILVSASCTMEQRKWIVRIVQVGALFIFTDTILFIQGFTHEGSAVTQFLQDWTSWLVGGEAIVILLMYTHSMKFDDRRNAVMYHNGATAKGFMSSVQDALEAMYIQALSNGKVRDLHREELELSSLAFLKALSTRAAKKKRKAKADGHVDTLVDNAANGLTKPIDQLHAEIKKALDDLNGSDVDLPDFRGTGISLN